MSQVTKYKLGTRIWKRSENSKLFATIMSDGVVWSAKEEYLIEFGATPFSEPEPLEEDFNKVKYFIYHVDCRLTDLAGSVAYRLSEIHKRINALERKE